MTKEQAAERLEGREIGNEIRRGETEEFAASGLLVAYGYSDDNVEFDGVFQDEVGAYEGGEFWIDSKGVIESER